MNGTIFTLNDSIDTTTSYTDELNKDLGPVCKYIVIYQHPLNQKRAFELQNTVEDTLRVEIDDITIFKHPNGENLGISSIEFSKEVPISQLNLLEKEKINQIRAFKTRSEYEQFMNIHSLDRLELIKFKSGRTPLVYIGNFNGSADDLRQMLRQFGTITLVRELKAKNITYFIAYFEQETSASFAVQTLNQQIINSQSVLCRSFYSNAYQDFFAVRGALDAESLKSLLSDYGNIKSFQEVQDGESVTYIISMESEEINKACCMLLNGIKLGHSKFKTFFVDKQRFLSSRNQRI